MTQRMLVLRGRGFSFFRGQELSYVFDCGQYYDDYGTDDSKQEHPFQNADQSANDHCGSVNM